MATDMDKAQSRLNDAGDSTQNLELTMIYTRCLPEQVNSSIEVASSNCTKTPERISKLATRDFNVKYEEVSRQEIFHRQVSGDLDTTTSPDYKNDWEVRPST